MIVDIPQKEFMSYLERKCVPVEGQMHLTEVCNLKCVHCYRIGMPWGNELRTDEWIRIINEVKDEGTLELTFSGGEPMMHPGWREIMAEACRLKFRYEIFNNGTVVKKEDLEFLRDHDVKEIHFSIHGVDGVHDRFVKMPGAYRRAIEMMRYSRSLGIKTVVKMSVMQGNFASIDALADVTRDAGGIFAPSYYITPRFVPGDDAFLTERITGPQIRHFEARYRDWTGRDPFSQPDPDENCFDEGHPTMCNMGWSRFAVGPQGDLYPCSQVPEAVGNIRHKSFREVWRYSERLKEIRMMKGEEIETCGSCNMVSACKHRCMGFFKQETGHYDRPAPDHCRITAAWIGIDEIKVERKIA